MALFKDWQDFADARSSAPDAQQYWNDYFLRERDFYAELLDNETITGTVKALAERFGVDVIEMTGFLRFIKNSKNNRLS